MNNFSAMNIFSFAGYYKISYPSAQAQASKRHLSKTISTAVFVDSMPLFRFDGFDHMIFVRLQHHWRPEKTGESSVFNKIFDHMIILLSKTKPLAVTDEFNYLHARSKGETTGNVNFLRKVGMALERTSSSRKTPLKQS